MTDKERLDFLQNDPDLRGAVQQAMWDAGYRMRIVGDIRLAIDDAARSTEKERP